jgi:hypothetical protein
VFPVRYELDLLTKGSKSLRGCELEYFHRSRASRRRRRKANPVPGGCKCGDLDLKVGGHESDIKKYGYEFRGIRTRELLCWRGSAAIISDRPILSRERVPLIN